MAKIIGGEFAIDPFDSCISKDTDESCFASGRTSLFVILKDIEKDLPHRNAVNNAKDNSETKGTVLLPYYLCDSITKTVEDAGWDVRFYEVNKDLTPELLSLSHLLGNGDAVLLINYFGLIDLTDTICTIRNIDENIKIVVDNVQALFNTENLKNIDYEFNSYRKWVQCPEGSYAIKYKPQKHLLVANNLIEEVNVFSEYKMAGGILKNFTEYVDEEIALRLISEGERELDCHYKCMATKNNVSRLKAIDYKEVKDRRKRNASILHKGLVKLGIEHIYDAEQVPLFIPIFVKNRNELRRRYFEEKIYTPIHWPKGNMNGCYIDNCEYLYRSELSLICDQRYDDIDMLRELQVLEEFCKDGMFAN